MRRLYVSVADFRAPFDPVPFQGLGQDPYGDPRWHHPAEPRRWPRGRTYWETAYFRAPYRKGYYQDNSLFGLGAEASGAVSIQALQAALGAAQTGTWDPATEAAVRKKQKALGLPETGGPDVTLLSRLGLVDIAAPSVTTGATRWRDIRTAFNQVPQWAYLVSGGLLAILAWKSYQGWRRTPSSSGT
jgi:hypothetical protein